MSNQEAPKIEFPCANYPVKVVGKAVADYQQMVTDIIRQHAPDLDEGKIQMKTSSKGNFCSMTFFITATGTEQLSALHSQLTANPAVHMVI